MGHRGERPAAEAELVASCQDATRNSSQERRVARTVKVTNFIRMTDAQMKRLRDVDPALEVAYVGDRVDNDVIPAAAAGLASASRSRARSSPSRHSSSSSPCANPPRPPRGTSDRRSSTCGLGARALRCGNTLSRGRLRHGAMQGGDGRGMRGIAL